MADYNQSQIQYQKQSQKQVQRLSHVQIQALNILAMNGDDLRTLIYKEVDENPALEIIKDGNGPVNYTQGYQSGIDSDTYQKTLEATEDRTETLQSHLMHQLNSISLSPDEYEISEKLIYNLDANGFYGSMLSPESLLNRFRPLQTKEMLARCMDRIQRMDPVGTCCRTPEESLLIQAKIDDNSPELSHFILDGHIELLNPPEPLKVYNKLLDYQEAWHKKKFAGEILLDTIDFDEDDVAEVIDYILHLNIHPAQGYIKDTNSNFENPDVVLRVEKKQGALYVDDYSKGLVTGDNHSHFQIKYASGVLPELRLVDELSIDKANYLKAQTFLENLAFRESTIVLQGCAIVKAQKDFFLTGGNLNVLTRKEIASELGIHESTVSRMTAKNNSKYIQTEWGLFPASYFFKSGVTSTAGNEKISSEVIKNKIQLILQENKDCKLSDEKLTRMLNEQGIKIARRTVAKYRNQSGISNSYVR